MSMNMPITNVNANNYKKCQWNIKKEVTKNVSKSPLDVNQHVNEPVNKNVNKAPMTMSLKLSMLMTYDDDDDDDNVFLARCGSLEARIFFLYVFGFCFGLFFPKPL